jgi:enoyl-CoA hydratase/carnithine racemase
LTGSVALNRGKKNVQPVLFSEEAMGSFRLGRITLNNPRALNALNFEMFRLMAGKLQEWKDREDIACLFLSSDSDKAFSSGGDIRSLAAELRKDTSTIFAREFFAYQYFVDYLIQVYPKPILCWADGITIGGGVGIMNGASHRVVTERTVMAMPEISLGFFPDVGSTYFLNHLPEGLGIFLGLTGTRFNGVDAVAVKMADGFISSDKKKIVVAELLRLPWTGDPQKDRNILTEFLAGRNEIRNSRSSRLLRQLSSIQRLTNRESIEQVDAAFRRLKTTNEWLQAALGGYFAGSPTSAKVIFEQLKRGKDLSLKEAFLREWDMAMSFCFRSDFYEGIRALLLDKDRRPAWDPPSLAEVRDEEIEQYFTRPTGCPPLLSQMMEKAGMG